MNSELVLTLATGVAGIMAILLQRLLAKLQSNNDTTEATQKKVNRVAATAEATESKVDVLSRALQQVIDKDQDLTAVTLERDWHRRVLKEMRANPDCGDCLQRVIEAMDRRKTERRSGDPLRRETDQ